MKQYKVFKCGKIVETQYPGQYAGWNGGRKDRKIFGRLDCKSGMRMKKENRIFFHTWKDAVEAGYRPCKKCKPEETSRSRCKK